MNTKYTWLSSALIIVASAFGLTWTVLMPAQADQPNTSACKRSDEAALLIATNHYVPDEVLRYAKRHCKSGTKIDDEIVYTRHSEPTFSTSQPCHEIDQSLRPQHEAECIVSWLAFWDDFQIAPEACVQQINAEAQKLGLNADLTEFRRDCKEDQRESVFDIVVMFGLAVLGVFIFGMIFGRGDRTPDHGYTR